MTEGPTITTIAQRAGLSIASVSRVLNGLPTREDTVRRVMRAADELGYVPNSVARSLRNRRTHQIAFALSDIGNPVYVAMVREIQAVLKAAGYRLLLHSTEGDPEDEVCVLRGLRERYVDGLIISPLRGVGEEHIEAVTTARVPVVVVGPVPEGTPVDTVRGDSRTGVLLAMDHLHGLGRRRIGLLNGPLGTAPGAARAAAYREALELLGLPYDESLVEVGDFTRDRGARAARALLARAPGLDALMCASDLIALGALDVLREQGRDVPGDVAVVGMDDTELASVAWPSLTSVSLGWAERGRAAARLLLDRLRDGSLPPRVVTVEPGLMVRCSTGGGPRTAFATRALARASARALALAGGDRP
ncbi:MULTISPECIES: LacI family DNA-binding transcriptional regulator [Microbispora]|uniref:LacI family transcriptional regulator n=2 Tax=Microbispora TaxID=2005 RepID=A0A5J5K7K9_9ACTN|nr:MULTISPECIES: LacI family DNA-binding transcriptional regulator [Microbispora]KAA9380436.1 LacI family transcriptional regulator [Microbispora cellulosiformans]GIH34393.1 LacI family transcriptional regulator [Microbispora amethystogenes]